MRVFFAAHDHGLTTVDVPRSGFLVNRSSLIQDVGLPGDFILDGVFDKLERVNVFEFHLGAQGVGPHGPQRQVGFTSKAALLHVAVADVKIHQDVPQGLQIRNGFFRRVHVRLGHDFQQRRAGAIEINETAGALICVKVFPRVFFQVRPSNAHRFGRAVQGERNPAVLTNGQIVLRNLIPFRQIRIEIIFSRELVGRTHGTVQRQSRPNGHFHGTGIDGGKRPG